MLKLVLQPAAVAQQSSAAAAASAAADVAYNAGQADASNVPAQQAWSLQQQEQQQQQSVVVFGSGKGQTLLWRMQAAVTPWCDDDSLAVWASRGAVIQQQHQQAAAGSSVAGADAAAVGSSGLSLKVDGQEVASMEAFVQQLIALSQQAQQQQQQQ